MPRRRPRWRSTAVAILLGLLPVAGCSGAGQLTVDDSAFQGLDAAVVREVLSTPVTVAKIEEEPAATQVSLVQGLVRNVELCRAFAGALDQWQRTGVAPEVPSLAVPAHPVDPEDWANYQGYYDDALASGDVDNLRAALTNSSACGAWVTTQPGGSTTIAESIQGG